MNLETKKTVFNLSLSVNLKYDQRNNQRKEHSRNTHEPLMNHLCWAPDTPRSTRASLVGGLAKCSSLLGLIQGGLAFGLDPCEEQGGGS